ncbi:double strand break repair nuclease mre11 [Lycorma delicatula]|uniref:double strand break repair nuclease mre11 n=1 Tax=Lycorma delicatula TaxID=130591 RepID=UPI003F518C7F
MEEGVNSADVLNILIASDVHLGYEEKDLLRGKDTFTTFEEILSIAVEREVDFILLGGDLFHDSKPSQKCLHEATRLLRRYCMGDRPVAVEFLSDQAENFQHCVNPVVNYEDPNFNIAIPVFSIHGNHDDPTGFKRLSSLDLLSVSGLVNYFGKWTDLKQISISPLLMRKGVTKLALYGLSYIKDERLSRLFRDRKVQLYQPKEATDEWFNIFVLHQNRANRGINNTIPEDALPKFLDVVIWGHEHECRIRPEINPIQNFSVIQPGSSVATSLCEGEAQPKHVGILKIHKKKFELEPIKLKTVRPFIIDTVVLSKINMNSVSDKASEEVQDYLEKHVNYLLEKSKSQLSGDEGQPEVPLLRVRVEYSNEVQTFNPLQFGLKYTDKVANSRDIILLKKERMKQDVKESADLNEELMKNTLENANAYEKLELVVEKYFNDVAPDKGLKLLSVKGLNEAVSYYIEKADTDAVSDLIAHQINKSAKFLKDNIDDTSKLGEAIEDYRAKRTGGSGDDNDAVKEAQLVLSSNNRPSKFSNTGFGDVVPISDDEDDDYGNSRQANTSRGKGRGRGRGSRGGKQTNGSMNSSRASGSRGSRTSSTTSKGQKQLEIQTSKSNVAQSSSMKKYEMDWSDSD